MAILINVPIRYSLVGVLKKNVVGIMSRLGGWVGLARLASSTLSFFEADDHDFLEN